MKTIHPIPPAGSEEALIQALETLLDQENPDEARLQALLDQLDRQTGAAPLDPEAGWADLQHRRSTRPKRRGLRRFPLALAAVLVCLAVSGTALAVNFGLHETLADLFQVNESNQTLVADAIDTPEAVYQKDGITITVKQTIADDSCIYAIYEVTVPEGITIPETAEPAAGVLLPQLESSEGSRHQNAGGGYHEILKRGPHHWTALVTSEGNSAPLADNPIRLVFLQFGYDTAEGSHVALEQEPIVLEWNLSKSTQAITVTPDQTVTVGNHTGKIETVSLSPISFTAFLSGTIPETPSLKLILRDGTECTPKNLAQDVKALYTDDGQRSSFFWRFEEIIDPSDVEKIVVGATEIVL